jgi:hypothetical protein
VYKASTTIWNLMSHGNETRLKYQTKGRVFYSNSDYDCHPRVKM